MNKEEKKAFSSLLVKTWREATSYSKFYSRMEPEKCAALKEKYWSLREGYRKQKNA